MTQPTRPIQEEELHAFVDGRLDLARHAEVAQQVAENPALQARLDDWRREAALLRQAFAFKALEPVPPALHLGRLIETRMSRTVAHWRVAAGIVLALGVGAAGGWGLRDRQRPNDMEWLTMQASSAHRVFTADATRPVELGPSDQVRLVNWMSSRLGRHVGVPDLTRLGYRFIGGRVLAAVGGPAGLLMYDDAAGNRVTVYLQPMNTADTLPMRPIEGRPTDNQAVAGYAWINNRLGASVLSSAGHVGLHAVANEVRDEIRAGI